MKVIVVADGDPPLLAQLLAAADVRDVAITSIGPVGAQQAIDAAVRATAGVVVGVGSAAGSAFEAASAHGAVRGFVSLDGDLEAHHVELISEWPELLC